MIVDPHMHLWNLETIRYPWLATPRPDWLLSPYDEIARTHLLDDFLRDAGNIEVLKTVHVEAGAEAANSLLETQWLQSITNDPASGGRPNGIVAAVDLRAHDIQRVLEEHKAFPAVRGVRQILNVHSNPFYDFVGDNLIRNPRWISGFSLLSELDLSFDLQIYPSQMTEVAGLAKQYPNTMLILNHTGMFVDRATVAGWRVWRDGMRALASNSNITVKVSGMGMLDRGWTIESIRPYVLEMIDCFGVDRCMFASNFPVDRLFGSYEQLWRAYSACVAGLSEPEMAKLFRENAERIYRI